MLQSEHQLRKIYGYPKGRAKEKVLQQLEENAIRFIGLSPFVVISTFDRDGRVDTSPRGGKPGFVRVKSSTEIVIPDSKGNNRVDSMTNILDTGRIGMLFMIPGVDETLRINGGVEVSADEKLLTSLSDHGKPVRTCLLITVEEAFLHCAKALMRSRLWSQESQIERGALPTIGQMLNEQLGRAEEPESQADMVKRYQDDL